MATIKKSAKKYATGGTVTTQTTKKPNGNPADEYKGMKDAKGKPAVNVGGEGKKPPFDKNSPVLPLPGRKAKNMPKAKKGATIKKAQTGTVSRKFDRPADTKSSPYPTSGVGGANMPAKNGKSMKKCKDGCK